MTNAILADALGHHVWATLRILDACSALSDEQLATTVPGTFGSIIDTLRHTVGADVNYLAVLAPGEVPPVEDEDSMTLDDLRATTETCGRAWAAFATRDLDGTQELVRRRDDGSTSSAPLSIRVAQVLHHGTDHRSQVCTALTTLGIQPPEIDVWDYAWKDDRLVETPPTR